MERGNAVRLADPRRQWGNKRHKLEDILVMGLCTIVCGGEDFTDMENNKSSSSGTAVISLDFSSVFSSPKVM